MKMKTIYIVLFLLFASNLLAQKNSAVFNAEGENAIYTKEWGLGLRFHTNGYSAFFEHVWIKDIKKRKLVQVGFFFYSDLRERKIETRYIQEERSKKYFYGKINNFYGFNLLYGNRRVIANKSETSGVKLSLTYAGGVTFGLLKPYYLRFIDLDASNNITFDAPFSDENAEDFLNANFGSSPVYGVGGFGKGFNEIQFLPGLQAKLGFNFDFARKNNVVTSLEVGSQIDVFYQKVKIYASERNKPYILNLYLSIQIGKRK